MKKNQSSELIQVNRDKTLPDERYDEKLFKQAYKAAKEAKESEVRSVKKKKILKVVYSVLSILLVSFLVFGYIHLRPKHYEYLESYQKQISFENTDKVKIDSQSTVSLSTVNITAQSAIAFDPDTGKVIYQKNIDDRKSVASLTKLMSVLVVLDSYDLDSSVNVSIEHVPEDLTWRLGLENGDTMSVKDLLEAMMISSYNDAAYAFANAYQYGGYEGFVSEMNEKAKSLGMNDSHFANPAGLDDENNYSTARDISKLVTAVLNRQEVLNLVKKGSAVVSWNQKDGVLQSKTIYTTDQLYGVNQYIQGLKTGYTEDAAQCFAGYFIYPNGKRLITVVLGSDDRFADTTTLEAAVRKILK